MKKSEAHIFKIFEFSEVDKYSLLPKISHII